MLFVSLILVADARGPTQVSLSREPTKVTYSIEREVSHDRTCFTEGLFIKNGHLFESCGRNGESKVVRYTWPPNNEGQFAKDREMRLAGKHFGEGISILNNFLYVLTYHTDALRVSLQDFDAGNHNLLGLDFPDPEGWGLTTDGCDLISTTGAPELLFLDPQTLHTKRRVPVKCFGGAPTTLLNEIEFVPPRTVWANIWHTNTLVRIDAYTGECDRWLDLSHLGYSWAGESTPNGIALWGKKLVVTGKNWRSMFVITMEDTDLRNTAGPAVCSAAAFDGTSTLRTEDRKSEPTEDSETQNGNVTWTCDRKGRNGDAKWRCEMEERHEDRLAVLSAKVAFAQEERRKLARLQNKLKVVRAAAESKRVVIDARGV